MTITLRAAPMGKRFYPFPATGLIGWTAGAPISLVVVPTGAQPGVYVFGLYIFVRVAAVGGSLANGSLAWNQPGLGSTAATVAGPNPTTLNATTNLYRSVPNSGLGPISYTLTPAGITGSPIIDIAAYATLVGSNP
jgi:hypothetical protein